MSPPAISPSVPAPDAFTGMQRNGRRQVFSRLFLEIVLVLIMLMVLTWSPGQAVKTPDTVTRHEQPDNAGRAGAALKTLRVRLGPAGYSVAGRPLELSALLRQLSEEKTALVQIEPQPKTPWSDIARLWSALDQAHYDVQFGR